MLRKQKHIDPILIPRTGSAAARHRPGFPGRGTTRRSPHPQRVADSESRPGIPLPG